MTLPSIPNTPLLEDPTRDAIWKRWLNLSFKNVNAVSSALYVSSAAFHLSTDFATSTQMADLTASTVALTVSTVTVYAAAITAIRLAKTTTGYSSLVSSGQLVTFTNAPFSGNPTKWIPIDDNGTIRYIPAW